MMTNVVKRRIAIAMLVIGGAAWIAEMAYFGVAVLTLKAMFWP
jgi:hypothetical protein